MLVVGGKEAESQTVSYRDRVDGDRGAMPLAEAVAQLKAESDARDDPPGRPAAAPDTAVDGHGEQHAY